MNKFSYSFVVIVLGNLAIFSNQSFCEDDPVNKQAKEILENSQKIMTSIKSSTNERVSHKKDFRTVCIDYSVVEPDGVRLSRSEYTNTLNNSQVISKSIFIKNRDGDWFLDEKRKTATNRIYLKKLESEIKSLPNPDIPEDFSYENDIIYSIEEKSINGFNAYIITKSIKKEKIETLSEFSNKFTDQISLLNGLKGIFEKNFPIKEEIYINKLDFFKIGYAKYNVNGEVISKEISVSYRINIPIDRNIFEIPKNYKKNNINKTKEYEIFN